MAKQTNTDQQGLSGKGELRYKESAHLLFLGLPWPFRRYEFYDNDLVVISGFLSVDENDCYMYRISDVELKRSFLQRLVGLSTVTCYTSDVTDRTIVLKNIRHGRDIKDFVMQAAEASRMRRRSVNMQNIGFGSDDIHDVDSSDMV